MLYLNGVLTDQAKYNLSRVAIIKDNLTLSVVEQGVVSRALRQDIVAISTHFSTKIEGNPLSLAQVSAVLRGEQIAAAPESKQEVVNYAEALDFVRDVAGQTNTLLTLDTISSIHYLLTKGLRPHHTPGQFRTGQNYVVDATTSRPVYVPPLPEQVRPLMRELLSWLDSEGLRLKPVLRASLVHLNVAAIHPFNDGNGRIARLLEALIMHRAGERYFQLISLEEYPGIHTQAYYAALSRSLGSAYNPANADISPWFEYALEAHAQQGLAAAARVHSMHDVASGLVQEFSIDRSDATVFTVARVDRPITNALYRQVTGASAQGATRRLNNLVAAGLLIPVGRGRTAAYLPTPRALEVMQAHTAELAAESSRLAAKIPSAQASVFN